MLTRELNNKCIYLVGLPVQGSKQPGYYSYLVAVKQQLFKGKGSIGHVVVNSLGKYLTKKTTH